MTATKDVADLEAKAAKAQAALDAARQAENDARAQAQAQAAARWTEHEQRFLDDYNPATLRADVRLTFEAMVTAAMTGTDLTAATLVHLAAIIREEADARRARDAVANGATPRPDLLRPPTGPEIRFHDGPILRTPDNMIDHHGRPLGSLHGDALTDHAQRVTFEAVAEAARRLEEQRQEQAHADREAHVNGSRA